MKHNQSEWKQERTWPVIQAELIEKGPEAIAEHNAEVQANLDKHDAELQAFLAKFENL